jgi:DNA-binding GntR family transcriptional regulator
MPAQLVQIATAPDLVDQVYRSLLDAISSGALAPGERITQEDIAQRLAVSRQPVLQALRLLKKDGFVLDAPGRGVLVAPLDADWMRSTRWPRGWRRRSACRSTPGSSNVAGAPPRAAAWRP